jgi:hypothetical protein
VFVPVAEPLPAVLLDSNVYRGLSDTRFDTLLAAELSRGVARYCEPFVISEFLAHLANPADPDFVSCRRAVVRVYRRCNVGAGGECGILRDSESRLAEFVTGKGLAKQDAYTEGVVAPLFADIALTPFDQPLTRMEPHLRLIAAHMAEVEAGFADDIRRLKAHVDAVLVGETGEERKATMLRARKMHESPVTRRTFAEIIIQQAYSKAGTALPDPIPGAVITGVLVGCGPAIEFEALIWEKVVFQDAKPESQHIINLRWDQRIAYNIGWMMRGRPLWLVTDDRDFARAATAAGYEGRVHKLAAYERSLGIGT